MYVWKKKKGKKKEKPYKFIFSGESKGAQNNKEKLRNKKKGVPVN